MPFGWALQLGPEQFMVSEVMLLNSSFVATTGLLKDRLCKDVVIRNDVEHWCNFKWLMSACIYPALHNVNLYK